MRVIPKDDVRYTSLQRELSFSCLKFSKYFFSVPNLLCRITCHVDSFTVRLIFNANGKMYQSVCTGINSKNCIERVVEDILRNIEEGGTVFLLRGDRVPLPKIVLQCRE